MHIIPAIVIIAYNRTQALQRLLTSVANASYGTVDIPLIISIDKSDNDNVLNLCTQFEWKHGEKTIIAHSENLGLKKHILQCGSLTEKYGAVIMLEDDLMVSPQYFNYALQALNYYGIDADIAGISLYSYAIIENGFFPFHPLTDGNSTYFMQLPASWGQLFTIGHWQSFMQWYNNNTHIPELNKLPAYINAWGEKSWKRHYANYMIENDKYFVYPKQSYSTNFGDPGTNTDREGLYQVPLAETAQQLVFPSLQNSNAVYDMWFELLPAKLSKLVPALKAHNYSVDLYGSKELADIKTPYLLSSKPCANPLLLFGNKLASAIQNLSMGVNGDFYKLAATPNFQNGNNDPLNYYISLNPIKEIVVDKYITHKFNEYVALNEFNLQNPLIHVFILNTNTLHNNNTDTTIQSIKKINYPNSRIVIDSVSCNQNGDVAHLSQLISQSEADYFILLKAGEVLQPSIIAGATKVMRKYPDINWLTFTASNQAPLQRWNSRIYELSLQRKSMRHVNSALTIFSRNAWLNAFKNASEINSATAIKDIWRGLFETQQLYTCIDDSLLIHNIKPETLENSPLKKVWEWCMVHDIAYLRAYYKGINGFPSVVRQTENGTYFLSDY